ncbi:UvrD-helicase domain-containing protein [Peptacetobacter hiranonis]|uniref:UvrD-helicase domain-containing protein n=1 Tax=Peptacetobacter hiranonis TaxID=89152 RepID=UPI0022E469D0|nr:UvrD-helicase domain-containing protein [Peptacetobacter hiranonis]
MAEITTKQTNLKKVSEKYNELIKQKSGKCSKILFLVSDGKLIEKIKSSININSYIEEPQILTYISFIMKELEKYWTLISKELKSAKGVPNNIPYSLPEYIITEMVENFRYKYGYFEDITGTSENISKSIYSNLRSAAYMNTDIYSTGEKIYYTKKNKDNLERFSYTQNDEIIKEYTDKLIEKSAIDLPMAIYLYTEKLLKKEEYKKSLSKRYDYLLIDAIEKTSNSELELVKVFKNIRKEIFIYGDISADFAAMYNFDLDNIVDYYSKESELSSNSLENKNLANHQRYGAKYKDLIRFSNRIKECYQSQLYTEMIDDILYKIEEITKNPKQIGKTAVILPPGSGILHNRITDRLQKMGVKYFSTSTDFKISQHRYANLLIIIAALYAGNSEIEFSTEEYIQMLSIVLGINKIKANKIFRENEMLLKSTIFENSELDRIYAESREITFDNFLGNIENENSEIDIKDINNSVENVHNLDRIIEKIYIGRKKNLKRSEFMRRFYTEVLITLEDGIENIEICKKVITECEKLEEAAECGVIKDFEIDKILKAYSKDYIGFRELKNSEGNDKLMITTPFYYINSLSERGIQLWADCGNNMWNPKIAKEINNSIVLRKSYEEKQIFTDLDEEKLKKYYMNNLLYSLLDSAEEVYAFKSDYSLNGYLSENMMYTSIIGLMDKEEI